ncbi:MAG: extracellular solute-binding protein [Rhodospirillaceae bacterium]|nr:extracellular solute-binding protein [Rhodospirillaceae bacterium]
MRINPYRSFVSALVLAGLAAAFAPAPASALDPSMIAAAKKEGEVVWYTGLIVNAVVRPLSEAFERKYGIKVKHTSTTDAETMLRITNEARAGRTESDVFDTPGTVMPPLVKAGLVERYTPESVAEYDARFRDKDGYWNGIFALYLTVGYNTELVKPADAPKTFQDLLDPKWQGKMAWVNNRVISGPAGFIANVLAAMGPDAGTDYLRKLGQQKIVSIPSNQRVVLDQVIAGQYPIGLMVYNHHAVISAAQGAPVAWVKMEPLVANLGVVGLTKGGPHPNAGKLFLEFLFSEEGQTVIRDANYPPAHPKVKAKEPSISPVTGNFKITMITPEATGEPLAGWLKIYDEFFK